ncbi:hypothetical protein DVN72_20030 [Shigella flexneri]|nr:hypothetical protein [Shigella flexneri]EFZ3582338.1 hypothetical protein [Shigella flexneri]RIH25351.1 hypothetical protein CUA64_21440 [Shigella flexneri]
MTSVQVAKFSVPLQIFPPPVKDGREYLFHESAVKVDLNRPVTGSLLKRIRNGKKAKS